LLHLATLLATKFRLEPLDLTYHPCLGLDRDPPYSAVGGEQSVNRQSLDELKQQIPLLDYLEAHDWRPVRRLSRGRWMGLCPLHDDHKPSFLIDPRKNLFYCYGCGRGGDVISFAELYFGEVPRVPSPHGSQDARRGQCSVQMAVTSRAAP
jgi:hypothetical protein